MESESQNMPASEVVRTKRLEVVDEDGNVRAAVGTRENGIGGLQLFDDQRRLRVALEVGQVEGEASGFSIFDTQGRSRARFIVDNDPEKGTAIIFQNQSEANRAVLGVYEDGQATLSVSGGEKERAVKLSTMADGRTMLMFTGEDAPMLGLGSFGDKEERFPSIVLADRNERAGVVIGGHNYKSHIRFTDGHGDLRAGLELNSEGGLDVTTFGEGRPAGFATSFERKLAERGVFYQALVAAAFAVICAVGGAWIAGMASTAAGVTAVGSGTFPFGAFAALGLTVFTVAALIFYLLRNRS